MSDVNNVTARADKLPPEVMAQMIHWQGIKPCDYMVDFGSDYGRALATELKKFKFKEAKLPYTQEKASYAVMLKRNKITVEIICMSFDGAYTEVIVKGV